MEFMLGVALAARLNRGFLPIRKADKLCVATDPVDFSNRSGRPQGLEMRLPAFAPGTRVLQVDQWIETGGMMAGALRPVERQGGSVAGVAAIAMETRPAKRDCRSRYPCVTAVVAGSRRQAEWDAQRLCSFAACQPERTFRAAGRCAAQQGLILARPLPDHASRSHAIGASVCPVPENPARPGRGQTRFMPPCDRRSWSSG